MIKEENGLKKEEKIIYVYVTGEVNTPSVIELFEGARVKDAIEKAGGLTDSGEIKNLNLAYKLKDGEKLYIPSLDEVVLSEEEGKKILYISSGIESVSYNEIEIEEIEMYDSETININTCTQTELETLSGIGPSTAKKIIDYRKSNGEFNAVEEIKNVPGIGEAKYEAIKEQISI